MKVSFCALFALTCLLVGSVLDAGASSITSLWVPVGAASALLFLLITESEVRRRLIPVLWPVAIWLVLLGIYVINPSHVWEEGVGLLPRASISFLPRSVHAPYSLAAWTVVATAACIFMLALSVRRNELQWLQWIILTGAAMVAVMALNDRLAHRASPIFERTGPFTYENHYAAFANLLLPVVLAAGMRFRCRALRRGQLSSPAGVALLVALLLSVSILLSGSRAGAALLVCSGLIGWGMMTRLGRQAREKFLLPARSTYWVHAGMALAFIAVMIAAFHRYGYSIPRLSHEVNFRMSLLADTWRIWLDSTVWGTGPGTFRVVFPYYQSATLGAVEVAHAHCDPLQWLAELGGLGLATSVVLVGVAFVLARRTAPVETNQWPLFRVIEGPAFGWALVTLILHSLVDFSWRMPAITWVASAWMGFLCAGWERKRV